MNATNQTITLTADTIHNLANLAQDHFEFGTLISCYLDIQLNEDFFDRLWREHSSNPTASLVVRYNAGRLTEQEFSELFNQEIKRFYEIAAEYVTEDFDIDLEKAAKVFELASLDFKNDSDSPSIYVLRTWRQQDASQCDGCECAECEVDCSECDFSHCRKVDGGCPVPTF